jgi:hypothetical protein
MHFPRLLSLLALPIVAGCSSQMTLQVVDAETRAPIRGAEVEHVKITLPNLLNLQTIKAGRIPNP